MGAATTKVRATRDTTTTTTRPSTRPNTRRRRLTRIAANLLTALLVGYLALMGASGNGGLAYAILPCPFASKGAPETEPYRAGVEMLTPNFNPMAGKIEDLAAQTWLSPKSKYGNQPVTAWEWYKTGGLTWHRHAEDSLLGLGEQDVCWDAPSAIGNTVANQIFQLTKAITSLSISMYEWASSPNLMSKFLEPVDCVVKGCKGGKGLYDTLYLNFLAPVIVLGALWAGWHGLVKKRSSEAVQGGVWMICSAIFALIFMAQPSAIANFGNSLVSTINSTTMAAVTRATTASLPADDMCYLPPEAKNAGIRMASCSMYKALLFTPWAAGQFGVSPQQELPDSSETVAFGGKTFRDPRIVQLEAQAVNHDEASDSYSKVARADAKRWEAVRDQAKQSSWYAMWKGEHAGARINIAIAALFAAGAAGTLVIIVAFASVVLSIGMLLLILVSPLMLLVGAHPGFGRGIALRWLELLLGTALKRIVLGFVLAVLIGFYQIVLASPMSWFGQIALILAVGIGAIIYRKPLLEAFNMIKLGGTGSGLERSIDIKNKTRKATTTAVGALAGGIGAARGGGGAGGVVGGVLSGAMSGTRTGSLLRAARVGHSVGQVRAARVKAAEQAAAAQAAKEAQAASPEAIIEARAREHSTRERIENLASRYQHDPVIQQEYQRWKATSPQAHLPQPPPQQHIMSPQRPADAVLPRPQRPDQDPAAGGGQPAAGAGSSAGSPPTVPQRPANAGGQQVTPAAQTSADLEQQLLDKVRQDAQRRRPSSSSPPSQVPPRPGQDRPGPNPNSSSGTPTP